ncbi:TIGR00266 family protein [Spirosomataceae bacterium TFI 002]|nr:TIGR00266 family protein [Spirosomataceae bacterium TFI 002]
MRSHEIDYEILGEDIQVVQIELDPNETVIAEAGTMLFMEDGIQFETKMGDGSQPNQSVMGKIFQAGSRVLMGESLFMTHFTNRGHGKRKVAFAAPYPGTIKAVDLSQIKQNTLIVQKDAFLCAAMGTSISIHFNKRFGAGLFGGEGFILERIQGDGLAFIHSGGVVMEKTLNNETLRIDTGCIVAYEPQLNFDVQSAGGLKSIIFGGEGMFLATLSGTGKVWIQSLPISKLIQRLSPAGGNKNKESGSVLGGITDLFER